MGYKPTLGGLKKAQEFLKSHGYDLPVIKLNAYNNCRTEDGQKFPGGGFTVRIEEEIRLRGALTEVDDVLITDEKERIFVGFVSLRHLGTLQRYAYIDANMDVAVSPSQYDYQWGVFLRDKCAKFVRIARWGKARVSILDRIKFRYFPKWYADEAFS